MKIIKISTITFCITLFASACATNQPPQVSTVPYQDMPASIDEYWAKDNLDLQRVGALLEKSESPQEFEAYLNNDDGINNLDLNGDGYVDYISVDEFEDRGDRERGLSLYTRFGPDRAQEVATIVFYRDDPFSPGARVLVTGNEQIYGDNIHYETNWLDRGLAIASLLFSPREVYYHSPYYYDNYPPGYVAYEVVDTPVYRTRIANIYPEPLFVLTAVPTFINKVKIKSPNNGLHLGQIKARLVKPTRDQIEFRAKNPGQPVKLNIDKPDKWKEAPGQDKPDKEIKKVEGEKGNPSKPAKVERPGGKPEKPGSEGKKKP